MAAPVNRAEQLQLADMLENASRVAWRWLADGDGPQDKEFVRRIATRFGVYAHDVREFVSRSP